MWPPDRRVFAALLLVALVAAAGVRFTGIDFGLPWLLHPDEPVIALTEASLLQEGPSATRDVWLYPPAFANLNVLIASLRIHRDPLPIHQLVYQGRLMSVTFSLILVLAVAGYVKRVAGTGAALTAAFLAAVSPQLVEHGRYATTDIATAAGVMVAATASTRIILRGRWWEYVLAGASVGLAAAFKYIGAWSIVLVVIAYLSRVLEPQARLRAETAKLLLAGVASLLVFCCLNPQVVWQSGRLVKGLQKQLSVYGSGHPGFTSQEPALETLQYLSLFGLGIAACGLAILAVVAFTRHGTRLQRWTVLSLVITVATYVAYLSQQSALFMRNAAHITPLLCALAGIGFGFVRLRGVGAVLVAGAVLAVPAVQSTRFALELRRPDTRLEAARWLRDELPEDSRIAVVPSPLLDVYLPPGAIVGRPMETIRALPSVGDLQVQGFTHLLIPGVAIDRARRSLPVDRRAESVLSWYANVEEGRGRWTRFVRRAGPGADAPGSTVGWYHNPTIEILELGQRPRSP